MWMIMIQAHFEILIAANIILREKKETPERLEYIHKNSS